MKVPTDFCYEYRFVGEESNGIERVNFDDVRIVVVETAMKIKHVDTIEYGIGEYVVSCSRHIL